MDGIEVAKRELGKGTEGMDSGSPGGRARSSCSEAEGFRLGDESIEIVCAHHFVIEPPNGPVSIGTCKLCGFQREHRNSLADNKHWMSIKADADIEKVRERRSRSWNGPRGVFKIR